MNRIEKGKRQHDVRTLKINGEADGCSSIYNGSDVSTTLMGASALHLADHSKRSCSPIDGLLCRNTPIASLREPNRKVDVKQMLGHEHDQDKGAAFSHNSLRYFIARTRRENIRHQSTMDGPKTESKGVAQLSRKVSLDDGDSSRFSKAGVKRNPSCQSRRGSESSVFERTPFTGPNKSRRLSPASSSVRDGVDGHACLPDPRSVADRRSLLALTRQLCRTASLDSFASVDSPVRSAAHLEGDSAATPTCETTNGLGANIIRRVSAGNDADADDESIVSMESKDGGSLSSHGNLEMSPLHPIDVDDDDSIAFSIDSVRMRKNQFSSSQRNLTASPAPPQQIIFDLEDDESVLHKGLFQTTLTKDDNEGEEGDDRSLNSIGSLDSECPPSRMRQPNQMKIRQ